MEWKNEIGNTGRMDWQQQQQRDGGGL